MKRHIIAKSTALAALALLLLGTSIAMANVTVANTAGSTEDAAVSFQIIPIELPEIYADSTPTLWCLSTGTIEKLLARNTAYFEETRPLARELKSKWAALTNELAKQSPEETKTVRLQGEISALDTRLTEMRLDHLMALSSIKTTAVN